MVLSTYFQCSHVIPRENSLEKFYEVFTGYEIETRRNGLKYILRAKSIGFFNAVTPCVHKMVTQTR